MRSRTELVTTTFIDSEDDFTETDDSEEDWRPSASNRNGKKRSHTTKGRNRGSRKRKSSGTSSNGTIHKKNRRQAAQDAIYHTFDDSDDEDDEDYEYYKARTQLAAEVEPKAIILPPKKKEKVMNMNGNSASGIFQLFLYRKDLKEDYVTNSHLCLWRKDGTNLLQKYIRVKTGVPDEFEFTSSSVYSTWDEKRRRDFVNIAVKCHEENHRRVTFVNTTDLHTLARSELETLSRSRGELVDNDESDENDADAEFNSEVSECEENDGSFQPEEDEDEEVDEVEEEAEAEIECDEDNVEEIEDEEEQASEDDDPNEEEFDDFEQLDDDDDEDEEAGEEEEEEDEGEDIDDEDKENQYESEHD